jgi:gas vesicle protein
MFLLGIVTGMIIGSLLVVFFARRNLNTLKKGSDSLHLVADHTQEKIKNVVDKHS